MPSNVMADTISSKSDANHCNASQFAMASAPARSQVPCWCRTRSKKDLLSVAFCCNSFWDFTILYYTLTACLTDDLVLIVVGSLQHVQNLQDVELSRWLYWVLWPRLAVYMEDDTILLLSCTILVFLKSLQV